MNRSEDEQHIFLLSIFHYILGGLTALFACFPIFHFTIGIGLFITGLTQRGESDAFPMTMMGLFFSVFAGAFMLFGWAFAACIVLAGRFLSTKKRYLFCLVVAAVECMFTPFGTVLGVFTIVVLVRPSVKELFMQQAPEAAASQAA